ncbi:hypothetical protein AB0O14_17760 [Microbacterium foliorum]|uniref:hypothetical protein n=1 Tax=Rothia terrae TaxID=396015 RepID=UPI003436EDF1
MGIMETPLADRVHCLTYLERAVLRLYIEYAHMDKGGVTHVSQARIIKEIGAARDKVFAVSKKLEERGFIELVRSPGRPAIATVQFPVIISKIITDDPELWESMPDPVKKRLPQPEPPPLFEDQPMF